MVDEDLRAGPSHELGHRLARRPRLTEEEALAAGGHASRLAGNLLKPQPADHPNLTTRWLLGRVDHGPRPAGRAGEPGEDVGGRWQRSFLASMEGSSRCLAMLWCGLPSHGEGGLTAAIVARSLLAALRSSWLVGELVGWVVVRLVVCWPVSWEVVVAVDMRWFLFWFV